MSLPMGGGGREISTLLDALRDKNLMQLKKLNAVLFPVRYNDKYYADALASGEFTKLGHAPISLTGFIVLVAIFLSKVLPHLITGLLLLRGIVFLCMRI